MASLTRDKQTGFPVAIQFFGKDKIRRTIRLSKLLGSGVSLAEAEKTAEEIKNHVEALNRAQKTGRPIIDATQTWLGKIGDALYDRLAEVKLVEPRAAAIPAGPNEKPTGPTLGEFVGAYIAGRPRVKPSTASVWKHTQQGLVAYFGADKPLADITAGDAEEWREWLATEEKRGGKVFRRALSENTIRRRCGVARQFFRHAVKKRIIAENPLADMHGVTVRPNKSRDYFVTRQEADKVLEACPDVEWQLIFALSRYGGLRCPSEHLALTWSDVDLAAGTMLVSSPKTEHHGEEHASRVVPIFPELRPYLEDARELAPDGAVHVIRRYRDSNANLRTQLYRIIKKAKLKPWPKLFQNLRATRATELVASYPAHVAADWLGHSALVAQKHYWRTTEDDLRRAASEPTGPMPSTEALQQAVRYQEISRDNDRQLESAEPAYCGSSDDFAQKEYARQDSNLRPAD